MHVPLSVFSSKQCFPLNLEGIVLDLKLFKDIGETRLIGKRNISQQEIEENPASLGDT